MLDPKIGEDKEETTESKEQQKRDAKPREQPDGKR